MEKLMEDKNVPEEDRDEIRRFAEILQRRKETPKELSVPLTPEMIKWLKGEDT